MATPQKIAVAGATGRVGRHVVDLLVARGCDVVPMSRALGVDVVTGEGLDAALTGVECIIDVATGPSPEQQAATEFFVTASQNLHDAGRRAGVERLLVVSIIGIDRATAGYGAAKVAHEHETFAGPIPAHVLRASQFHEFVGQMVEWGTQGDVASVPEMRTQLVAARSVAEVLADLATASDLPAKKVSEVAGPREERLVEVARLLAVRRGHPARVDEVRDPTDPDAELGATGGLLPGPDAILAGPTFAEWLDAQD